MDKISKRVFNNPYVESHLNCVLTTFVSHPRFVTKSEQVSIIVTMSFYNLRNWRDILSSGIVTSTVGQNPSRKTSRSLSGKTKLIA